MICCPPKVAIHKQMDNLSMILKAPKDGEWKQGRVGKTLKGYFKRWKFYFNELSCLLGGDYCLSSKMSNFPY